MGTSRRVFFVVQGEGRGHMTQALALQRMLTAGGHEVVGASVGSPTGRDEDVPAFFREGFDAPLYSHPSQPFARDRNNEGIRMGRTVLEAFLNYPAMNRGAEVLGRRIRESGANVIVNFYDAIASVLARRMRPRIPVVVVGHQFLLQHPNFHYPPGKWLDQLTMRVFNRFVGMGAAQRWALSYYPDHEVPQRNLIVIPPILRAELFRQELDRDGGFLLVYMLNFGYLEQLRAWHARHPEWPVHCFCKRPGAPESELVQPNLTVHELSDEFLSYMARCRAVVSTAGFESLAEALYLGKPAYMIPTRNHYEQFTNAFDAQRMGLALSGESFDLDPFLPYIADFRPDTAAYRTWVHQAGERVQEAIDKLPYHNRV